MNQVIKIDECNNCSVKGNYEKCLSTECCIHDNWFSKQNIKKIKETEDKLRNIFYYVEQKYKK